VSENRQANLPAVETRDLYERSTRRLSREDLLARSPARPPLGQQRPYQLSLPEDSEDREGRPAPLNKDIPVISPPSSVHSPSSIQQPTQQGVKRLGQPTLRHPESPAGYPLPDDEVFSPVNPSANNFPPPPPPKWPQHLDNTDHHHLNIGTDLNRSNTRLTAVSGISQVSGISAPKGMLAVSGALDKEMGGREGITPSPSPPTPGISPPPPQQPSPPKHDSRGRLDPIQTTTLNRGPSPDLYNASPRLPPAPAINTSNNASAHSQNGGIDLKENKKLQELASAREEKIYYDRDRLGFEEEEDTGPAAMSATSYPGQEWNPYAGVYEDGFD